MIRWPLWCWSALLGALVVFGGCGQPMTSPSNGGSNLPGGSTPSNVVPMTTDADLAFCVSETNRYRAMKGRPALVRSLALDAFAADSARIDQQANKAHQHYISTNGGGVALAENEFTSSTNNANTAQSTMQFAISFFYGEGPGGGHYENLVGSYTQVGCGVYRTADVITVAQDFR